MLPACVREQGCRQELQTSVRKQGHGPQLPACVREQGRRPQLSACVREQGRRPELPARVRKQGRRPQLPALVREQGRRPQLPARVNHTSINCPFSAPAGNRQNMACPLLRYYLQRQTVVYLKECFRFACYCPIPVNCNKTQLIDALVAECQSDATHDRLWRFCLQKITKEDIRGLLRCFPQAGKRLTWGGNKESLVATVIKVDKPPEAGSSTSTPAVPQADASRLFGSSTISVPGAYAPGMSGSSTSAVPGAYAPGTSPSSASRGLACDPANLQLVPFCASPVGFAFSLKKKWIKMARRRLKKIRKRQRSNATKEALRTVLLDNPSASVDQVRHMVEQTTGVSYLRGRKYEFFMKLLFKLCRPKRKAVPKRSFTMQVGRPGA